MRTVNWKALVAASLAVLALGGCAYHGGPDYYRGYEARSEQTVRFGVVEAIRDVRIQYGESGVGAASGAMSHSHLNRVADADGVRLGIVSPDGKQGMVDHANDMARLGIGYVFDPGQGLPMFSGEELMQLLGKARALTVNDYEARVVEQKTGRKVQEIAAMIGAVVVTRGADGSTVHTREGTVDVPSVRPRELVDPTGCGDAYRAGLLHGMARDWPWKRSAQLASVMGSIKIAHRGGQNHRPSRQEIAGLYREAFGEPLWKEEFA